MKFLISIYFFFICLILNTVLIKNESDDIKINSDILKRKIISELRNRIVYQNAPDESLREIYDSKSSTLTFSRTNNDEFINMLGFLGDSAKNIEGKLKNKK